MMMTWVSWLVSHILEILILVFIGRMAMEGHKDGAHKSGAYLVEFLISLALAAYISPFMVGILNNLTGFERLIEHNFLHGIVGYSGLPALGSPAADQSGYIAALGISEHVKSIMISNNIQEVWGRIGAGNFQDYVGLYLSNISINAFSFIIWFVVVWFSVKRVEKKYEMMKNVPEVKGPNQLVGALLSGFFGIMFLWIGCLGIMALSGTGIGASLLAKIKGSLWLNALYEYNLVDFLVRNSLYQLY